MRNPAYALIDDSVTVLECEKADQLKRLIQIIKAKSFFGGTDIRLASGRTSNFYFDMKPTAFDPEGATLIAELIVDELIQDDEKVEYIGGLEMGAVPIIACVCMHSHPGNPIPGFFVRKKIKDHGTRRLVEGLESSASIEGKNVAIVDDVTTTGESVYKAVEAAQQAGARVTKVITVVDRLEGARNLLEGKDLQFVALATRRDFEI